VASVSQYNVDRRLLAGASATPVFPTYKPVFPTYKSNTRVDIALLASALFLQRFGLPLFHTFLTFDFVFAGLIFVHQYASGRLFIQYDRLLWFLVVVLAATSSLLLNNFKSRMLTSYGEFMLVYFLFALSRPSTPDQYKSTLQGFQFLVLILCCLGIAQFAAQFVVDGRRLVKFFGIVPDVLFAPLQNSGANNETGAMVKSNGLFLAEPSTMSQMAALGILIEVLEFRRPRYLITLTLGFLLAYSGTGSFILLLSLPLAALVNRRAQLPIMLVTLFAVGLLATGIISLSVFTARTSEFQDAHSSGFMRYVSTFWMAEDYFPTASPLQLLLGNGPGGQGFVPRLGELAYNASGSTWFNLIYSYGLIGAFVFTCFLASCFRRSRCPKPLIVALIYTYLVTGGSLVGSTPFYTIMVVLCTLSGPEPRRRADKPGQYPSSLVAGSRS
jgi:hypothetical protein